MGRLVYLKILGGITILLMLSLAAALLLIRHVPPSDREPASVQAIFVDQGEIPASEVYSKTAVANAVRARKVSFNPAALEDASKTLVLELFPDTQMPIELQDPSKIRRVNQGLLVGQVSGDPESQVRIQFDGVAMDARIATGLREFRVVPMGGNVHWVIETRTKNSN